MSAPSPIRGLYAITDPTLIPDEHLLSAAHAALKGGARLLQYRDKTASRKQQRYRAQQLQALCAENNSLFIVNDDPALAAASGADGVHIGQADASLERARDCLGSDKIIGVTCHSNLDLAKDAAQAGADYVAFGRFFSSHTKPSAPAATLDILSHAQTLPCPVVAIGGITPDNAPLLLQQGVQCLAVIHALFRHQTPADILAAAQHLSGLLASHSRQHTP